MRDRHPDVHLYWEGRTACGAQLTMDQIMENQVQKLPSWVYAREVPDPSWLEHGYYLRCWECGDATVDLGWQLLWSGRRRSEPSPAGPVARWSTWG